LTWGSLWRRVHGDRESLLSDWPFDRPAEWVEWVNAARPTARKPGRHRSRLRSA
jgi:hypothetical protein